MRKLRMDGSINMLDVEISKDKRCTYAIKGKTVYLNLPKLFSSKHEKLLE